AAAVRPVGADVDTGPGAPFDDVGAARRRAADLLGRARAEARRRSANRSTRCRTASREPADRRGRAAGALRHDATARLGAARCASRAGDARTAAGRSDDALAAGVRAFRAEPARRERFVEDGARTPAVLRRSAPGRAERVARARLFDRARELDERAL